MALPTRLEAGLQCLEQGVALLPGELFGFGRLGRFVPGG